MASAVSNVSRCSCSQFPHRSVRTQFSNLKPSLTRFSRITLGWNAMVVCTAASAAGRSSPESDFNPYEVLGVNPFERFDTVKTAYAKRRKEAEKNADETTATTLEKAYDNIMMSQMTSRKKGVTHGSTKVPKEIKYADKQPIVLWGPRFTKSSEKDNRINLAIAAVLVDGEDRGRALQMGKQLLRSLALVFGCVAVSAVVFDIIIPGVITWGYTLLLNLIEYAGGSIPVFLYNNQELMVTTSAALILYVLASYCRCGRYL